MRQPVFTEMEGKYDKRFRRDPVCSARNTSREELSRLRELPAGDEGLPAVMDAMPELVMIVGPARQLLLGNAAM